MKEDNAELNGEKLQFTRVWAEKSALSAVESFIDTDKKYLQNPAGGNRDDGCTAVTAVLVGQKLFVANVGDSRAVLSRGGKGTQFGLHPKSSSHSFIES